MVKISVIHMTRLEPIEDSTHVIKEKTIANILTSVEHIFFSETVNFIGL